PRGGLLERPRHLRGTRRLRSRRVDEPVPVEPGAGEPGEEVGDPTDRPAHASAGEPPAEHDLARRRIARTEPRQERRLDGRLDVRTALVLVEDGGARIDVGLERVLAQDARAEGVDRGDLRTEELAADALPADAVRLGRMLELRGDDFTDALLHLRRRFFREGD